MNRRAMFIAGLALTTALTVTVLGAASLVFGDSPAQEDATAQQQTVDALVGQRFTQTAIVQQQQTAAAAQALGPTLTAAFEATVDAAFDQAMTNTARANPDMHVVLANAADAVTNAGSFTLRVLAVGGLPQVTPQPALAGDPVLHFVGLIGRYRAGNQLEANLTLVGEDAPFETPVVMLGSLRFAQDLNTGTWGVGNFLPGFEPDAFPQALGLALDSLTVTQMMPVEPGDEVYQLEGVVPAAALVPLTLGLDTAEDQMVPVMLAINIDSLEVAALTFELSEPTPDDAAHDDAAHDDAAQEVEPITWRFELEDYGAEFAISSPLPTPTPTVRPSATPRPAGLPTDTVAAVQIVEQVFEHGRMLWIRHTRQIWVLILDPVEPGRGEWLCYNDSFVEGEAETDPNLEAPEGLIQPRRGFGKLWRTLPEIREGLGWASTPELEVTSNYMYLAGGYVENGQYYPGPGEHRLTTFNNESFSFYESAIRGDCVGGTWSLTP